MTMPRTNRPKEAQPMVGWFDPRQLMSTGIEVAVSTVLGRHSDHRLIEAVIAPKHDPPYDYTRHYKEPDTYEKLVPDEVRGERREIWIDYVADTGDGWDSTYAVASALARPAMHAGTKSGSVETQRGDVLIMGGDEVYPTANRKEYKRRLLLPFETALKEMKQGNPHVYAIPGNHDWYDSLVSFTRVFIGKDWFGGWFAPQDRSYFALKLPQGWWLLGVDTQLGSDLDALQLEYFEKALEDMGEHDRVILCCAEPLWVLQAFYHHFDPEVYNESNLAYLNKEVLKGRVQVFIAGDLHHYRRHANEWGVQKITCGGGGAFLHPTHAPKAEKLPGDELPADDAAPGVKRVGPAYSIKCADPDARTSRRITWRNLLFPYYNPWFGLFIGFVYLVAAWAFKLPDPQLHYAGFGAYMTDMCRMLVDRPGASFWALLMLGAWVFFTDTHSTVYKWCAGATHGFSHLAAVFVSGWLAMRAMDATGLLSLGYGWQFLLKAAIIFGVSGLLGSVVMGLYLLISLNVFGRHYNEAFSSLSIADYKSFLRMHIDAEGKLTIYPFRIHRVPRSWMEQPGQTPAWAPAGGSMKVELIEEPITVGRGG
jgi:hypothetical protein